LSTADIHHAQGFALRKAGDFEQAIVEYSSAIEHDGEHFKAFFNRGFAFDKLCQVGCVEGGKTGYNTTNPLFVAQFDQAISDYTQALRIEPQNAYTYYNRGISRDRAGHYNEAIHDFTKAINVHPENADFFHNRGFCHRKRGNLEQAIADYTQGERCKMATDIMATSTTKLTHPIRFEPSSLGAAMNINPNHFKAVYNRAFCYDKLNLLREAEVDYTTAIRMQNKNSNALHNRGAVYERMGRLDLATSDFEEAVKVDKAAHSSVHALAMLKERQGKFEEAMVLFNLAIGTEGGGEVVVYRHNRGFCKRQLGDFAGAVLDFSKALELDETYMQGYTSRGFAYRKLGNFKLAIEDYGKAIELDEKHLKSYNNRGYCYAKVGLFEKAVEDYGKVIEMDPENFHAYHNRGISLDKIGDFDNAARDFRKVLEKEKKKEKEKVEGGGKGKNSAVNELLRIVELKIMQKQVTHNQIN